MKTEIEVAYDDAIDASNELGFACMSAGDVIRYQADEIVSLKTLLEEVLSEVPHGWGTSFSESELAERIREAIGAESDGN